MNKPKQYDSDPEPDFDMNQVFYHTFRENNLDNLCNRTYIH